MKILSKALVFSFFLLSIFYLLFSAAPSFVEASAGKPTYAVSQTTQTQSTIPASNTNSDVPNNLHNWTQNVMIEVMLSLTCQLVGIDPTKPNGQCLGVDQKSGKIGFLPSGNLAKGEVGGAIGGINNMISMLYTPPLHTSDYFQNLAQNFGISKHAFAQNAGIGFQGLTPLIGIWSAFRNIVYLFLVIVFIVIGLAIMLRIKIDPRTVMSIQNQIPKIIIGILVVTFSFAIAGFLIDMMYVLTYLLVNIIAQTDPKIASDVTKIVNSTNPFSAANDSFRIGSIIGGSASGIGGFVGPIFDNAFGRVLVAGIFGVIGKILGGSLPDLITYLGVLIPGGGALSPIIAKLSGGLFSWILSGLFATGGAAFAPQIGQFIGFVIASIVISIALLFALFRLWFTLIMAYVYILIDVVLAPFWIIGGIIPGSPISLTGWLRDIVANLAAFPAVIAMFMLGKVFMDAFGCDATVQTCKDALAHNFVPPLIGNPGEPSLIGSLIGLGIILMTPNVVNMLKTALKTPKVDTGIGKAIGVGAAVPGAAVKQTTGSIFAALQGTLPPQNERGLAAVLRRTFGRI